MRPIRQPSPLSSLKRFIGALIPSLLCPLPPPSHSPKERDWAIQKGYTLNPQGDMNYIKNYTYPSPSNGKLLKDSMILAILDEIICTKFTGGFLLERIYKMVDEICCAYLFCTCNNPQGNRPPPLIQPIQCRGSHPGEDWQLDFTPMQRI